jgi:hypothetical protein
MANPDLDNPFIPEPHEYDHPDLKEHRALLRQAPRLAFYYARLFATGVLSSPDSDASAAERIGWMLVRRGYTSPPVWLRHEWAQESRA